MRVVRVANFEGSPPSDVTFDLTEINARSLIFEQSGGSNVFVELFERMPTDSGDYLVLRYRQAGVISDSSGVRWGVPLVGTTARFSFTGSNAFHGRVILLDELIRPFGRLMLDRFSLNPGVLGSSVIFSAARVGTFKYAQLVVSSTTPFRVELTSQMGGGVSERRVIGQVTAQNGGGFSSAKFEVPNQWTMVAINDDNANGATINGAIYGFLD